jgi:hypothetical protein
MPLSEQFQNRIDKQVFSVYYYHPSELRLCAPNLPSLCKYNYHTAFLQRFIKDNITHLTITPDKFSKHNSN